MSAPELALFATGSDGSTPQWDGKKTPEGILLRWLMEDMSDFPDFGFDVYRAQTPEPASIDMETHVEHMAGQTSYGNIHGLVVSCEGGLVFGSTYWGIALVVTPGDPVKVDFTDPAWYVGVVAGNGDPGLEMTLFAGGVERHRHKLGPNGGQAEWRARGIDTIVFEGGGMLLSLRYASLGEIKGWRHLKHLCLPAKHPAYPCRPTGGSDAQLAASRVPATADWHERYSADFSKLHPYLLALATHNDAQPPSELTATGSGTARPKMKLSAGDAIVLASRDPHLARAIGVAWDDPMQGPELDGTEWAYKVEGRWRGRSRQIALTDLGLRRARVAIEPAPTFGAHRETARLQLDSASEVSFGQRVYDILVVSRGAGHWEALDLHGTTIAAGELNQRGATSVGANGARISRLLIKPTVPVSVSALTTFGRRRMKSAVVPSVFARESGPPPGPAWIEAQVDQPGGPDQPARAALRWDVPTPNLSSHPGGGPVMFQPAAQHLSKDPTQAPGVAPPFDETEMLFDGHPVHLPDTRLRPAPSHFVMHRPVEEGWWAYRVRSVDMFGRVSAPSPATLAKHEDKAPPPPPTLLVADYAQADLDNATAALVGRTSFATDWLDDHPSTDAIIAAWAWTPEHEKLCADVDGFQVHTRRPANDGSWTQEWSSPIVTIGPLQPRVDGAITAIDAEVPVTVGAVQVLDSTHSRCRTDLDLDAGAGALIGARLVKGSTSLEVISNGQGRSTTLTVTHPPGSPPTSGDHVLRAGTTKLTSVETTVAAPTFAADPHIRRIAGVLVSGSSRLLVFGRRGTRLLTRVPLNADGSEANPRPVVGSTVSWYPAYVAVVADLGYGPDRSSGKPETRSQITVTSVRRLATDPIGSSPALPLTIKAVDITPPPPTVIPIQPTGERCVQLATRPNWHGVSRCTVHWNPVPGAAGYLIQRAMDAAVFLADRQVNGSHNFDASQLPADPNRRVAAEADLAALDAALAANDERMIGEAYTALRADAAQLIAGQANVARAYTSLTSAPLPASATEYEDRLDGKVDARWFYRVAARSASGVVGAWSPPTPPICSPDVVPPSRPRPHTALAGAGAITLRWARNAESDLAAYVVLRAADPESASDYRTMTPVARVAGRRNGAAGPGEVVPSESGGLLEYVDPAPPGVEWFYRIVAEDAAGNRSQPSELLRARSLRPIPVPPTWQPAVRTPTGILLEWAHSEPRLACQVERRASTGGPWFLAHLESWLPRGVYVFEDEPPDIAASWTYRIRVRDHAGHIAPVLPELSVPEAIP